MLVAPQPQRRVYIYRAGFRVRVCREVGQGRLYHPGRRSEGVGVVEREERKGEQGGSAELQLVFALSRVQADRMDAHSKAPAASAVGGP